MHPTLELLSVTPLPDFPSGSSITFFEDRYFLIGDDANDILILDRHGKPTDSIRVFQHPGKRIPKPVKRDLETSTLSRIEGRDFLLALGSGSTAHRMGGLLIALDEQFPRLQYIDYSEFARRLPSAGIAQINIEGCAALGEHLLLGNRANASQRVNQLVVTDPRFWQHPATATIGVLDLQLPATPGTAAAGVSELCWVAAHDLLLLGFSSEASANAYDDGAVGDSYLGWIGNISSRLTGSPIALDGWLNLAASNPAFRGEKIEGLCVDRMDRHQLHLALVSDDDQGHTKLFRASFPLPDCIPSRTAPGATRRAAPQAARPPDTSR